MIADLPKKGTPRRLYAIRFLGNGRDSRALPELQQLLGDDEEGVAFRSHLDGSSHFFSPESALEAEIGLGADIIMAFDECLNFEAPEEAVRKSVELTLRWLASP